MGKNTNKVKAAAKSFLWGFGFGRGIVVVEYKEREYEKVFQIFVGDFYFFYSRYYRGYVYAQSR